MMHGSNFNKFVFGKIRPFRAVHQTVQAPPPGPVRRLNPDRVDLVNALMARGFSLDRALAIADDWV